MSQTRAMSFVESWTNIFIGYVINFAANMVLLPLFGFDITVKQNLVLGTLYTLISLTRSYCIRRWFNRKEKVKDENINRDRCQRA